MSEDAKQGNRSMSVVGYVRVSTREQNPASQEAGLRTAGASRVSVDRGVNIRGLTETVVMERESHHSGQHTER